MLQSINHPIVPSESLEEFKWSTVVIDITSKKKQLLFEQLRLRANGVIALSAFHFRFIVNACVVNALHYI